MPNLLGRKLITKQIQDGEIDGVRAVGIGRMDFGLDVTGVVKQDVKDIMALMVVGADDLRIDGNVIGYQGVRDNTFL